MTFDPDQFFRLTALLMFLVAGFDVGLAALMRGARESTASGD